VVFCAVAFFTVRLAAVFLAGAFFAVLRAVVFFAVAFFVVRLAAVFFAVVFFAVDFFAALALFAGDFLAAFLAVLAVVVFRVELVAAEVAFAVFSSSVAGTNASCTRTSSPWPTCSTKKIALQRTRYQHFVATSFAPQRASGAT
jgi:hypothetical protein